jgi:DNA-binding NarL/FixJ family response regulator
LAFCRRAGYLPELAWTCYDYAEALLERHGPGDLNNARSLLDEALSISQVLGMRPLMERVATLKEAAESKPSRAPAYPGGLTQREVEVLCLVASGKSSAEIAAQLVLSRRTVERHISNIYIKTNTRNRSEAMNASLKRPHFRVE